MLIHYATAEIEGAAAQIRQASVQTDNNHQRSLQTVQANADNFGGQGSDAFQQVISTLNQKYAQSKETIERASVVLQQANEQMTHADGQSAGQYV
ncbi:WXG100 family type VII secretion target [Mycobacterium avium]|uniref:WXG100 family type VII secretion target n=1 Tax=Mycobacterium avium TaxID=1764 RepID=UPI000B4AF1D3|nr:WXG100 family type VII secretion target [Mycobacterium avium]